MRDDLFERDGELSRIDQRSPAILFERGFDFDLLAE